MFLCITATVMFLSISPSMQSTIQVTQAEEVPSYAKWGRLAVKTAIDKYPNAKLIDYEYQGSHRRKTSTVEKFKLWLKEDKKEFGLIVSIEYDIATEETMDIKITETKK
ncbi:YqzG/YhdC family protein [Aquibacillus koreensis]|uniref:YqzG/YhdC family protein n=1 Tax=Aquibacillus koreensis TaxID=279446 RepID=A0A9X4AI93_9BACI|nr:YqzG/YhdC family protein [Aquibacillus koreensis]MCT2537969.1 YqzG/YhdC family protein [Aquibacillus koreensis]MDC3419140.1 YqzG/YhdC family protein [Aquibacillus koreensis]